MVHRLEKMAVGTAIGLFVLFSALFGFTLSIYLLVFELTSVVLCFALTAVYFGALAAYGYATKRDLSNLRTILFSGLIFLIIFGVLSMFIPALDVLDRCFPFIWRRDRRRGLLHWWRGAAPPWAASRAAPPRSRAPQRRGPRRPGPAPLRA